MKDTLPALTVIPTPGRFTGAIELGQEVERRGFAGLYVPSLGDAMAMCQALAMTTETFQFGTSIANIYTRHPNDYAATAAVIHELAKGRFRFGVGVSHDLFNSAMGLKVGKPLADARRFVEALRKTRVGELPPIVLAALRDPMVKLAGEIAEGLVFANVALSRTAQSLACLPEDKRNSSEFFVGNMIPTCVDDDEAAALARNRATFEFYLTLPNYRAYWRQAGYSEDMDAVEAALDNKPKDGLASIPSQAWVADCSLYGSASKVRDGVAAWRDAGVSTPILVPSSTSGGQKKAVAEIFAAFA
jgi:alkanesulfonate monooxygenase SsuD/methylene tetrahydromethanopterin reductase-like flavin-dependent oxidoreductase (luciferase family)